ncbi:MAG TPA: adenylate/guanylate cyclase domain-containing protein [Hypericibacter adhaerens]|uniref:adenylate/guanylate cyclase domain-containing protein n=1 Tax=Hypericibacter adhaerens TaxID=2602016 RepID=UPI002C79913C|nr:adenylate/guanylate cyclase domain-containing protein [Hypericibacter adhaerens]HWA42569.1 adenylate/guanylate cyclase domain-containing protein [Hypericibacter adhaerens]
MRAKVIVRRVRLVTGLTLFAYLLTHYLNHAAGLISLDAMEEGRGLFLLLWRNGPMTVLLYAAILAHLGLAYGSVYQRRSLRMAPWEAAQLLLGLAVPPLIVTHVIGTRLNATLFGTNDNYAYELLVTWLWSPKDGLLQALATGIAWIHGCIGLYFWLRLKRWFPRWAPYLFALALLLPVLALLGFTQAGREVARLAEDPDWLEAAKIIIRFPSNDEAALLYRIRDGLLWLFALLLIATLLARGLRAWITRHRALYVTYPDGRKVMIQSGTTVLEASRIGGIPHASVCGGRGRCSTCRVRILASDEALPEPGPEERRVLDRVAAEPGVRLACQLRPRANLTVLPMLPPTASPRDSHARPGYLQGHEEEIAILFADLRAFTRFAERKLPYDVVFLLNRYFRAMGTAVEQAGGHLDKFIGDGVMALFGVGGSPEEGCRLALEAARRMAVNLDEVNRVLAHDLPEPLRIGIGIHVGPAIVGEMGYGRATSMTAIGDSVNTASRLEGLTKEFACQLVVSASVAELAGLDLADAARHEIAVRGRSQPLTVLALADARTLPPFTGGVTRRSRRAKATEESAARR